MSKTIVPPKKNIKRVIGMEDEEIFLSSGKNITSAIKEFASQHFGKIPESAKFLDFGCGSGRVVIHLAKELKSPLFCTDVDSSAINFLSNNVPNCIPLINPYLPPLPFADSFFDCLYSISVFTHLPYEAEIKWLEELARVTKSGALLMVSIASLRTLKNHHDRRIARHISEDALEKQGAIFVPNKVHEKDPSRWPGVTGPYGLTFHSHSYVKNNWRQWFTIKFIDSSKIGQDIVVMEKP